MSAVQREIAESTAKNDVDRYWQALDFQNRAKNLRRLIDARGSWHQASRLTGKSIQLLKQVAGDNPCRSIGDKLAQELEHAFRLPPGYLDLPN